MISTVVFSMNIFKISVITKRKELTFITNYTDIKSPVDIINDNTLRTEAWRAKLKCDSNEIYCFSHVDSLHNDL